MQFGKQEPGSNKDIKAFAQTGTYPGKGPNRKYDHPPATFDLFAKVEINGANADPVFKFLHDSLLVQPEHPLNRNEVVSGPRIKGNFNKWLIDKHGRPRFHFGKRATLNDMEPSILSLLDEDLLG
eukprot:m.112667 g.112667  ORF g.112667 m.112667 type:complete len:125 (-) comp21437_c0_seq1:274-648(-)